MWIAYSLGAMGFLAVMTLMFVPPGRAGVQPSVVLFYLFLCACVLNFGYVKYQRTPLTVSCSAMLWIVGAAMASFLGNLCALNAINLAPNPGYASAIEASKAPVVVILSVWLFASHFSLIKGLGALLCAVGVALLSL
jgi:uncharacterized membrane protein